MARSRTRKKFAKKEKVYIPPEISREIDQTAQRIKRFTDRELNNLQKKQTPLCIPVENGYRIGSYRLKYYPNRACEVWEDGKYLIHTFADKVSAVLYTIYTIKQNMQVAKDILQLDQRINKNNADIMYLRRFIKIRDSRGEYNEADIRRARLEIAEQRLKDAQAELARIHRTAKLNKVWL